ncbi:hypothetical protein CPT_Privateer_118 [Proteus phage Privateer]|uniref:Uncharacterized protein n=1 Tax=Proteus phage Privateer TaxID=2712958 RepID=A0A6G8R4M7_9CAUD|nr:hypothetical protein HWD17_gp138 [Proteus phage Privateer]QIN94908.1 hypothetical protein CPT_Privateer_118 [Proteus phage Privateer]
MKNPKFLKKVVVDKKLPYIQSGMTEPNDGKIYKINGRVDGSYIKVQNNYEGHDAYLRLEDASLISVKNNTLVLAIGRIKTLEIELDSE